MNEIVGLVKAIFLIITSGALILFGYLLSPGTYNMISAILFLVGAILCAAGIIVGVFAMTSDKEN